MSASGAGLRPSPYKFLDYYEKKDRARFFGRERETETLLSDVIATRIVVLFARTGTGKTSLINAGVRPRLEELDYETLYLRVERDPAASVRTALRHEGLLADDPAEQAVAPALQAAASRLQKPLVVFFDQFEEFFIYTGDPGDEERAGDISANEERARDFIANVAALYRDRDSGVHTVFSMREEYFVEMDAFRDEIPSIFHKDSSLRLQPFDKEQARRAIELPAREVGVEVEGELVDAITADLADKQGRIEPARIQIVCDTLWEEVADSSIGMAAYRRLGGAARMLERRLADDIKGLEDRQLALLDELLPQLRTRFDTKYTRGVEELVDRLGTDRRSLQELIDRLRDLRLIRLTTIHRALYVEWASDYLAERTTMLQEIVRSAALRQLLTAVVSRASAAASDADGVLSLLNVGSEAVPWSPDRLLTRDALDRLSAGASLLGEMESAEAEFLLVASMAHRAHQRQWFEGASARGDDAWGLVRATLTRGGIAEPAVRGAVYLLGELSDPSAMDLLEVAVGRPLSASTALRVLEELHTGPAIDLLAKVAREPDLAPDAIDALRRMGKDETVQALAGIAGGGDGTALRAASALSLLAGGPTDLAVTQYATAALDRVLAGQARALFMVALRHGLEVRFWFERAQERGVDVWELLRASVTRDDVPIEQAKGALRLLFELPGEQAGELIELASRKERLAEAADRAVSAREALVTIRKGPLSAPDTGPAGDRRAGMNEAVWTRLLERIDEGRCVPIVGTDAAIGPRPEEIAEKWSFKYELPASDTRDLALVSQLLAMRTDWSYVRIELVGELRRGTGSEDVAGPELHRGLASLPLPVYLTVSYDNSLEEALSIRGRSPTSSFLSTVSSPPSGPEPTSDRPLVFHLFGSIDVPDSLVLTEDDYLRLLVRLGNASDPLTFEVRRVLNVSWRLLLGVRPSGWPFRVLQHGLLEQAPLDTRAGQVATLLPPGGSPSSPTAYDPASYLSDYFDRLGTTVYWGDPGSFMAELAERRHQLA
jgi:SIR2-like domain